jgi:hypothetical protein
MMKRSFFLLCSGIIPVVLILLRIPVNADVPAQTVSKQEQQPYRPSHVDQLFANLPGSNARMNCVGRNVNEAGLVRWVAFYQWYRIGDGLGLSINSDYENLKYCASLAFEELRHAAFQMGFNPPNIEVFHYFTDEDGHQASDMYVCSIPAKTSENDYDTGRFENDCSLDLIDF